MGHSERKKILKDANYLDLKPIKMVEFSVADNIVTLLIPKFENKFLVKFVMPRLKSPTINLKLDELGSSAWLSVDGKKSVGDIASELVLNFGDKIQPVEERLTKFFTELYMQQFLTFEEIKGV